MELIFGLAIIGLGLVGFWRGLGLPLLPMNMRAKWSHSVDKVFGTRQARERWPGYGGE